MKSKMRNKDYSPPRTSLGKRYAIEMDEVYEVKGNWLQGAERPIHKDE